MANGKMNPWIIIAIVAIGAVVLTGNFPGTGVNDGIGDGTGESESGGGIGCGVEDVAFTPKMTRIGKSGTSLSTGSYGYYITTDKLGIAGGATATTVPVGYEMEIMFGENATDYYTVVEDVSVACADPFYKSVQLPQAETTLASFYLENSDGTVNAQTANETLGADDTFETTVTIKASSDQYWGNPNSDCQNIAVVEYDKTYILKVTGDDPAPVPGFFTYTNTALDGSNAFYVPKAADGAKQEFNIKIESTSSDPVSSMQPTVLHVYDCDIDKNEDSLALIHGVEDEDLNMLSLANASITIWMD